MNLIAELIKQIRENLVKAVIALILLLLGVIWAAVPSETWDRVSAAIPKPALWAGTGILALGLVLSFAYIFHLRNKSKPKEKFAFGAYWDAAKNPLCPACKTPLVQSTRNLLYVLDLDGVVPPPKPVPQCVKCDRVISLHDDDGNSLSLSTAKSRV